MPNSVGVKSSSDCVAKMDKQSKAQIATFIGQTLFIVCVFVVAVCFVRHYYYGENGYYALTTLQQELADQIAQNARQEQENARLKADIHDLKTGLVATEEHARTTLGLIKPNEIFVQVVETPKAVQTRIPIPTDTTEAVEISGTEFD